MKTNLTAFRSNGDTLRFLFSSIYVLLVFALTPISATTVTLNPVADAYVRGGSNASNNYGSSSSLEVRSSGSAWRTTYMKFDLSGISGIVTNATLRVYGNTTGSTQTTGVFPVADTSWTESGITWNNRPSSGSLLDDIQITTTSYSWYELDVTSYIGSEVSASSSLVSLSLENTDDNSSVNKVRSKEASSSEWPELVITYLETTPPSITSNPESITVDYGSTAMFSVEATGIPTPTYQWRKDGTPLSGEVSSSLSISNVSEADEGNYDVVVTNSAGSVTSSAATLEIDPSSIPVIIEDFSIDASSLVEVAGGTWTVSGGRYILSNPADSGSNGILGNLSLHHAVLTGAYSLSSVVRITGTGSAWNDVALVFGYQDADNYYYVSLNESNDSYTKGLFKVVSGTPTELVDFGSLSIFSDTDYAIDVDRNGSLISVFLNGSQIASISDATFSGGQVGYGSKNDGGAFDDLFVYGEIVVMPLIDEDFSVDGSSFSEVSGGVWSVNSGRYILSSPADSGSNGILGNISVHNTGLSGDYSLSSIIRITGTSSAWNDVALVFGYQDIDNYYYVSLNESNDGNTKGLFKVAGGSPTELADLGSLSVLSDTDYTVDVERSGSSIVVYVDGNQEISTTDSTFSGGQVGYGSKNDGGDFEDLIAFGSIGVSQVFTPQFSPGGGSYNSAQSVTITSATSGATIRYTTDGSTPTPTTGTVYSGAVSVGTTTTLKAIAYKSGMIDSSISSATYTINTGTVSAPQFSLGGGSYSSAQSVSLSTSTSGATIRYTTDGSTPTSTTGTVYSSAISVSSTTTLKAIAYKSGMIDSSVSIATYTISTGGGPVKPTASNTGYTGSLTASGGITITTNGAIIENLDISGTVNVKANNVTIRNCRIQSGGYYGIRCTYGYTGLLIEDCEISGQQSACIFGGNFIARRCYIHNSGADGIKPSANYVIESCYLTDLGYISTAHADGVQMVAGSNGLIRWNNFDMISGANGYKNSQCMIIQTNDGPIDDIVIHENWVNGGGWSIQIRDKGNGYGAPTNVEITNNQFGTDYGFGIILDDGDALITGNVWESTGNPAP